MTDRSADECGVEWTSNDQFHPCRCGMPYVHVSRRHTCHCGETWLEPEPVAVAAGLRDLRRTP